MDAAGEDLAALLGAKSREAKSACLLIAEHFHLYRSTFKPAKKRTR